MAREIIALLADPQRREQIGRQARLYVEREHSWHSHLQQLTNFIEAQDAARGGDRG